MGKKSARSPLVFAGRFCVLVGYLPNIQGNSEQARKMIQDFSKRFKTPSSKVADLVLWREVLAGGLSSCIKALTVKSIETASSFVYVPVYTDTTQSVIAGHEIVAHCTGRLRLNQNSFDASLGKLMHDLVADLPVPTLAALASSVVEDGMTVVLVDAAKKQLARG